VVRPAGKRTALRSFLGIREVGDAKGTADAEATRIYAEAYGKDPSFFEFWKAMESYKTTIPGLKKTLSTDMDYFKYLYSPRGR
jgi:membrane protease subunit HflC